MGQQELIRLIGRLKFDILNRVEQRGNQSSGLKEQDAATLDTLGWPQERSQATEFISFAPQTTTSASERDALSFLPEQEAPLRT